MYIVLCDNSINKKKVETALVVCGGVFFSNTGNKIYNKLSVKAFANTANPTMKIAPAIDLATVIKNTQTVKGLDKVKQNVPFGKDGTISL